MPERNGARRRELRARICRVLLAARDGLRLNKIATQLDEPAQLVQYHLERLIESGIVIIIAENGLKRYRLQDCFYTVDLTGALIDALVPLLPQVLKALDPDRAIATREHILAHCVIVAMELVADDLERLAGPPSKKV